MVRVLIAVDADEDSVRAAQAAHRLFGDAAHYLAVNVAAAPGPLADYPFGVVWPYELPGVAVASLPTVGALVDERHEQRPGPVEQAADIAADVANRAGVSDVETIGEVGDPVVAILEAAEHHDVDVIVVGSHTKSWFSRLLTGSVAQAVVRKATLPVLVVS